MRTIRLAAPFLAFALAALPAVSQWDAPPAEFHDAGRRGFHDGIEAARSDFDSHGQMDARRSPMFRHPPVPEEARHEYREGFMRGYDVSMHHHHDGDHDHDGDHHDGPPQQ